ncbi:MAG: N-acyl-D-amino-acid deacylase [Candidatus Azotimanducaceae bacterium]|jgi:N-acyl-D-amino-acid deacylase
MLDIIIKNGIVVDGSGMPGYQADIAIHDGIIKKIGKISEEAVRVIDARGKIVSPGFIDPHTHFDAQLLWDGCAKPAIEHGVTTIVPGNCSLSLAPLKAEHRMKLVGMFNQIEEMPYKAFEEGVEWDWESFDEFITRIKKGLSINVAPLVGHSVLRLWVMGDASMHRVATDSELVEIQNLFRQCLNAGAIGLSTSFIDMDERLQPVPSRYADMRELEALSAVLGEYGRILQVVPEFYDTDLTIARIDQLAGLSLKYGITTTFSPLFVNGDNLEGVNRIMQRVDQQVEKGARVWPQVQTRPIDISFSFEVPSLMFVRLRTWYSILRFGSHDEILTAFKDSATRSKLINEAKPMDKLWRSLVLRQVKSENNQQFVGKSLGEIAQLRGADIVETMIDLSVEEELQAHFLSANMGHNNDEKVSELLKHPNVHIGASDGGAHILSFSTYGDTGYLLGHFVREKSLLGLEAAVKKITLDTAKIWGLSDRGLLQNGYAGDVTIFNQKTISRGDEYFVDDVPGDGYRYVRDAIGIECVIINGELAYSKAEGYTDSTKGQILSGQNPL